MVTCYFSFTTGGLQGGKVEFTEAKEALAAFKISNRSFKTQNFAVAIAIMLNRGRAQNGQSGLRGWLQGESITSHDLQHDICDSVWSKEESLRPDPAFYVYKPFTRNFYAGSAHANIWRNSFDLQDGLGCDAPLTRDYLASDDFIAEHRVDCEFRHGSTGACQSPYGRTTKGPRTCFNPDKSSKTVPGPESARPNTPKFLKRVHVEAGGAFRYVEPTSASLLQLLGPQMRRVPGAAFASALYTGSQLGPLVSGESMTRLQEDLQLSREHFLMLFDTNETSSSGGWGEYASSPSAERDLGRPSDVQLADPAVDLVPEARYDLVVEHDNSGGPLSAPTPFRVRAPEDIQVAAGRVNDPEKRAALMAKASQGHQRTLNALASQLEGLAFELTEQPDGFDLYARHEVRGSHIFEIKTWTVANLAKQVRSGWAQLYEYRYRNASVLEADVTLLLVLDRTPPAGGWAWSWLVDGLNVTPCWMQEGRLATFERFRSRIAFLD